MPAISRLDLDDDGLVSDRLQFITNG